MTWHYNWTNQPSPLSSSEQYDNAEEIWDILKHDYGWTDEAAAAVIANFQSEGLLNPCQWQIGSHIGAWNDGSTGLGLGQWTPPSKLGSYMGGNDEEHIANGARQVQFTVETPAQWVQRVNARGYSPYYGYSGIPYITSIHQFGQSYYTPEDMATCWAACWEGPSKKGFKDSYNIRRTRARYWFNEFGGSSGMYRVSIAVSGNGRCSTNVTRAVAYQNIRVTFAPMGTDVITNLEVRQTSTWQSVATSLDYQLPSPQTFEMPPYDVTVVAQFTGDSPEPPTPPVPPPIPPVSRAQRKHMPIWMYPSIRRRKL